MVSGENGSFAMIDEHTERSDPIRDSARIRTGELDPNRLVAECLDRIATRDGDIGAFTWTSPTAQDEAAALSRELATGTWRGPLHGLPVAVKELFDVKGAPRTGGSLVLTGGIATADSQLVARIRQAGAVVVGTTRSHEFAWGITTQHAERGGTANPYDLSRIPGGSSGGAAAAVASGMVSISVGTDTGGSIRIPAAFCGVVGFKPSPGVLPIQGCIPLAPSFDTAGVIAPSVGGIEFFMAALGMSINPPNGFSNAAADRPGGVEGIAIGFSPALIEFGWDSERLSCYRAMLSLLEGRGARLVEISVPPAADLRRAFSTIQAREALNIHTYVLGTYPRHRATYGVDVGERLDAAARVSAADEVAARASLAKLSSQFICEMDRVDFLVTPIVTVAPPMRTDPDFVDADGTRTPLRDAVMGFSVPQNACGLPAVVIPMGFASDGLAMSVQVSTGPGRDAQCLSAANLVAKLTANPTDCSADVR